jgi:Holliday junction resolvase-like predicted endonuclease
LPSSNVDREKALNIMYAAQSYNEQNYTGRSMRIDVIEVYLDPADRTRAQKINHYPAAYRV